MQIFMSVGRICILIVETSSVVLNDFCPHPLLVKNIQQGKVHIFFMVTP